MVLMCLNIYIKKLQQQKYKKFLFNLQKTDISSKEKSNLDIDYPKLDQKDLQLLFHRMIK